MRQWILLHQDLKRYRSIQWMCARQSMRTLNDSKPFSSYRRLVSSNKHRHRTQTKCQLTFWHNIFWKLVVLEYNFLSRKMEIHQGTVVSILFKWLLLKCYYSECVDHFADDLCNSTLGQAKNKFHSTELYVRIQFWILYAFSSVCSVLHRVYEVLLPIICCDTKFIMRSNVVRIQYGICLCSLRLL